MSRFLSEKTPGVAEALRVLAEVERRYDLDTMWRTCCTAAAEGLEKAWCVYQKAKPMKIVLGMNKKFLGVDERPPGQDHARLYKFESGGLCMVYHPYELGLETLRELIAFCDKHELDCYFSGRSTYFPGQTLMVTLRHRSDVNPRGILPVWRDERAKSS